MKISLMQPTFLPWQGYFALIDQVDFFMFLDDFQYSKNCFHTRNRLFIDTDKIGWYNAPMNPSFGSTFNEIKIHINTKWILKISERIKQNYSKSLYYSEVYPLFEFMCNSSAATLADFNISMIKWICAFLGIQTTFMRSSDFHSTGKRSQRVLDLLEQVQATDYFAARGSFEYMLEDGIFPVNHISVYFQNYDTIPYTQQRSSGDFFSHLSIVDALFNLGPEQTLTLIRKGCNWNSWDEMKALHATKTFE